MSEKRVLLFLAQGFEDLEAVTILDVCGWTAYRPNLPKILVTTTGFHKDVKSRFGLRIPVDCLADAVDASHFDAFVLPGGFHSHGYDEAYDRRVHELARAIHEKGGVVATMCVGAIPIAEAGLLRGRRATTYPLSRHHDNVGRLASAGALPSDEALVEDNRIISCRAPSESLHVATRLLALLVGEDAANEVTGFFSGTSGTASVQRRPAGPAN